MTVRGNLWTALGLLMMGYAAVFLALYPPISGVSDEIGFINQAWVWSLGAVSSEGANLPFAPLDFIEVGSRHVPARYPGRSLTVLPFLVLGYPRAIFVSGLLLHLLMTAAGASLLVRLRRSPLWAVLLLFHPTLAIYSRTIMADGAAGTGLLLAALAIVAGRPIIAGLAVGLAAAMRYHAGLALPLMAGALVFSPEQNMPRRRRWLNAALCFAAGAAAGGILVAYNLAVYGTPNEPFTVRRGWFSAQFLEPHLQFYEVSLMVVWPGMLLTPLLDQSRLRWLTRGVIALFLVPLLFYCFHDRAPGWLETQILGQRLIQVALPLWVVAYACMLDDLVAAPLGRLLGARAWAGLVALVCIGLFASNVLASFKHQRYLQSLASARDALTARVPAGSLIVYQGDLFKLVVGRDGVQLYRVVAFGLDDRPVFYPTITSEALDREPRPWYLAVLKKEPNAPLATECRELIARHHMQPVPVDFPCLVVYEALATHPGGRGIDRSSLDRGGEDSRSSSFSDSVGSPR